MVMNMEKSWSATAVIFAALLMGGISLAAWSPQEPGRSPSIEEERKRLLEQLNRRTQESQQGPRQPPGFMAPQSQPANTTPAAAPSPTPASAPIPSSSMIQGQGQRMLLNFENQDLSLLINQFAEMLNITPIIIDPEVKGTVYIHSTAPMSKDEIMPVFSQILKSNKAALIKQGDIYQIIPISSAVKEGLEIIDFSPKSAPEETPAKPEAAPSKTDKDQSSSAVKKVAASTAQAGARTALPSSKSQSGGAPDSKTARMATHVIRPEYVPIKDLIDPIKSFLTDGGVMFTYDKLNMLMITDYSDTVERIMKIVRLLDDSYLDPDLIELVEIKNNAPADIVEDLVKFFGSGAKDSATGVQFIPLDRRPSIFVKASSKRALSKAKDYIALLDATSGKNIQTFTYSVQHSTASQIAMMLTALYGGEGSSQTSGATGQTSGTSATAPFAN
jgi:general secretion pathway protein D